MSTDFNVRVYGLCLTRGKAVLVSDEFVHERYITKFPGGGLQFGEGTMDCLKREFREELNVDIDVVGHFYTTDFFQPSFLNARQQVISIYYFVSIKNRELISLSSRAFDFGDPVSRHQSLRELWLPDANETDVTFPIDQKVIGMLKAFCQDS